MKKFCALLCLVFVALTLSSCSAFYDDTTKTYPQDDPLEATIFLQVNNIADFSAAKLQAWQGAVNTLITQMAADTDSDAPKITAFTFRNEIDEALYGTYTVDMTITNVPASTMQRKVRPFKIYYVQTIYNPIALLPESDTFTYVVGYTTERRHSAVNTERVETQDDGNYVYLWTTDDAIEFTDVYPNRPLYYLLVLVGAAVIGTIVYFISRHLAKQNSVTELA